MPRPRPIGPRRKSTTNPARQTNADLKSWARGLLPAERAAEIQRLTSELQGLETHHREVVKRFSKTNSRKGAQQEAYAVGAAVQRLQRRLNALQSVQ